MKFPVNFQGSVSLETFIQTYRLKGLRDQRDKDRPPREGLRIQCLSFSGSDCQVMEELGQEPGCCGLCKKKATFVPLFPEDRGRECFGGSGVNISQVGGGLFLFTTPSPASRWVHDMQRVRSKYLWNELICGIHLCPAQNLLEQLLK